MNGESAVLFHSFEFFSVFLAGQLNAANYGRARSRRSDTKPCFSAGVSLKVANTPGQNFGLKRFLITNGTGFALGYLLYGTARVSVRSEMPVSERDDSNLP